MTTTIKGRHRNARLAERHRRSLERDHPGANVKITNRRDRFGNPNIRGKYFSFTLTEKGVKKRIETLKDFFDAYDEAEEFEPVEDYETSADYGEEKEKK
jgi:hypothetical protein